jgi:excisionase family DNA binding protein
VNTPGGGQRNPEGGLDAPLQPRALSIKEAAAAIGCGETLVRRLIAERAIPHVRLGDRVVVPVAALDAWLSIEAAASVKPQPLHVGG